MKNFSQLKLSLKTFMHCIVSVICLALALSNQTALAEIYKKVDENGHITYSNVPLKGASKLNLDPPAPTGGGSSRSAKTPTPASFPKVDEKTQGERDDKRKEILTSELENEKKALEEAKKAYTEGESNPEMYTNAKGKRFRNVPKFQEKMQKLKADVDAHQRNIELLQKEIDALN